MYLTNIKNKKTKENIVLTITDLLNQNITAGYFVYIDQKTNKEYKVKYSVDININIDA